MELTQQPRTLTLGLNAGATFVVKNVKPYDKRSEVLEIWTIEDVVRKQVCSVRRPVALLPFSSDPYALLNTGVIFWNVLLRRGMVNLTFTFSLGSLADGCMRGSGVCRGVHYHSLEDTSSVFSNTSSGNASAGTLILFSMIGWWFYQRPPNKICSIIITLFLIYWVA